MDNASENCDVGYEDRAARAVGGRDSQCAVRFHLFSPNVFLRNVVSFQDPLGMGEQPRAFVRETDLAGRNSVTRNSSSSALTPLLT